MVLRMKCSIQIAAGRQVGGEERHHYRVQAGLHLEMHVRGAAVHRRAAADFPIPIVQLHPLAIDQQFQLLAADFAEGAVVVHQALIDGINLEHVVAVGRELIVANKPPRVAKGMPSM